jgi:hypothetical protein
VNPCIFLALMTLALGAAAWDFIRYFKRKARENRAQWGDRP